MRPHHMAQLVPGSPSQRQHAVCWSVLVAPHAAQLFLCCTSVRPAGIAGWTDRGPKHHSTDLTPSCAWRIESQGELDKFTKPPREQGRAHFARQRSERLLESRTAAPPTRNRQLGMSMERSLPKYQFCVMFSVEMTSAVLLGYT